MGKRKRQQGGAPSLMQQRSSLIAAASAQHQQPRPSVRPKRKRVAARSPYQAHQRVLLLGEGNFSFAHALVATRKSRTFSPLAAEHITATCFDTFEQVHDKYPDAASLIDALRSAGARVWDAVDCTRLHLDQTHFPAHPPPASASPAPPPSPPYDVIVFNFPHTGCGIADTAANVAHHRAFLRSFLSSLLRSPLVHPSLSVHVTVKVGEPYTSWRLPTLLPRDSPLRFRTAFPFCSDVYDGYAHRRTRGWKEDDGGGEDNGDISGGAMTYEWRMETAASARSQHGDQDSAREADAARRKRASDEHAEFEKERRRLQEEVRRVVSAYDVTHETTLDPQCRAEDAEAQRETRIDEQRQSSRNAAADRQARSTVPQTAAVHRRVPPAADPSMPTAEVERASHSESAAVVLVSTSSSALPPPPQRKAPKLRRLLF